MVADMEREQLWEMVTLDIEQLIKSITSHYPVIMSPSSAGIEACAHAVLKRDIHSLQEYTEEQ